jgi:hypothetical protein
MSVGEMSIQQGAPAGKGSVLIVIWLSHPLAPEMSIPEQWVDRVEYSGSRSSIV